MIVLFPVAVNYERAGGMMLFGLPVITTRGITKGVDRRIFLEGK